jgi:hypothetical protein
VTERAWDPVTRPRLIAFAIAAAVVVEERSGHASAGSNSANSSVAPLASGPAENNGTATANTTSATTDVTKPHFERTDEPAAVEDAEHPYGG